MSENSARVSQLALPIALLRLPHVLARSVHFRPVRPFSRDVQVDTGRLPTIITPAFTMKMCNQFVVVLCPPVAWHFVLAAVTQRQGFPECDHVTHKGRQPVRPAPPGQRKRTRHPPRGRLKRSEEHTSELQSRVDISYAVFS